jgi:hypothetical protein
MNAPDVAYQVARQFASLRRRYMSVRIAIAVCLAAVFMLAVWVLLAVLDYHFEFTQRLRTTTMVFASTAALVALSWRLVLIVRQSRRRPFAGVVERSFEDFGQRIRTVLDTVDGRVQGPQEMLTALGNQTLGRWESVSPARMIPRGALWASVGTGVAVSAVLLGLFGTGGDWRKAIHRAIGGDQPYTSLEVTPGDVRLLEGSPVQVSLDLVGRTERDVTLRYREIRPVASETEASQSGGDAFDVDAERSGVGQWIESELLAEAGPSGADGVGDQEFSGPTRRKTFQTKLGKATWPIEYQFVSSGQTTPIHRIEIQPLIETERIEIQVQPPEYTGLQSRLFSKPDLTVLERSDVTVTIQLNHPLAEATLEVGPKVSKLVAVEMVAAADRSRWTFSLPSTGTLRWRFSGSGADGTPMEPVAGRLGVRRDGAPSVKWREPSDEIKVHSLAEVPLGVQVSDDYGLVEAGIVFQLGGEDEYVLTDWAAEAEPNPASGPQGGKTRLTLAEVIPLESFALSERDYIAYYAYAVDNRPWGNHRSESDVRYIDIRPLRQFYQEVDPPGGNGGGGSRVLIRLDEIIRRERFVINRTRKLVRVGADLSSELGTIDRLVKNQSELADLTRFLAEFFISRGNDDVEALSQAEATMLQAADSLAAGSLDLSLAQEQDALRSLAEARRTLEIALTKRMTAAQQQALRRLARQLQQKLRRDRPETERELADSLKRIAQQQRQLATAAQSAASMQKAGPRGDSATAAGIGSAGQGAPPLEDTRPGRDALPQEDTPTGRGDDDSDSEERPEGGDPAQGEESDEDREQVAENDRSAEPDPTEMLFEQQIDLLERLEAVRDQLSDRLTDSGLMTRRMDDAQSAMDDLATKAREGEFESLAAQGRSVSDHIDELSLQLEALSAAEPIARVSSLRDLTGGLASMEHRMATATGASDGLAGDKPNQEVDPSDLIDRLARRMAARSETLEEVIGSQADVGDIEMSEVNDQLQNFVEETEFQELLTSTMSASRAIQEAKSKFGESFSSDALERAVEYAESAKQLERLYQQLVTPRLARLRRMEQRASRLANRMAGGSGGGGKKNPETESELRQLKTELQEEGLRELAEMLDGGDQQANEGDSGGGDDLVSEQDRSRGAFAIQSSSAVGRVRLVAEELRKRIQQVILLEIAVDRDTPIPSQYRRAVDGYFKALAAEDDGSTTGTTSGGSL